MPRKSVIKNPATYVKDRSTTDPWVKIVEEYMFVCVLRCMTTGEQMLDVLKLPVTFQRQGEYTIAVFSEEGEYVAYGYRKIDGGVKLFAARYPFVQESSI